MRFRQKSKLRQITESSQNTFNEFSKPKNIDLLQNVTVVKLFFQRPILALGLVLVLHSFFYFWSHSGLRASDDLFYAKLASDMSRGSFELTPSIFENRFGVIIPTSLSYHVFGVNKYSTTLWPLICSIVTIVVVFIVANKLSGKNAAILSSFLLATNLAQIKFSSSLYPEITLSLFMIVAISALFFARNSESTARRLMLATLCAFSFLAAALTKLTVVWVLPFLIFLMIYDFRHLRNFKLWFYLCFMAVVVGLIYFVGYYIITGDLFYRFTGISEEFNAQWGFQGQTTFDYIRRLTYKPLLFFLRDPRYAILFALSTPALLALFWPNLRSILGLRFWPVYVVVFLASFWFGSTSLSSYTPMPLREEQRFFLPLLAPLAILGGITMATLWKRADLKTDKKRTLGIFLAFIFFLITGFAAVEGRWLRVLFYGLILTSIFFLLLSLSWVKFDKFVRIVKAVKRGHLAIILILVVSPIFAVLTGALGESPWEKTQRQIAHQHLTTLKEPTVIFTDSRSKLAIPFFFGFSVPSHIKFVDWDQIDNKAEFRDSRLLVFVNRHRVELLNRIHGLSVPRFVYDPPADWRLLDGCNGVYLHEISQPESIVQ